MSRALVHLTLPALVLAGCGRHEARGDLEALARVVVTPQQELQPVAVSMARLDEEGLRRALGLIRNEASRRVWVERARGRLFAQDPTLVMAGVGALLAHGDESDLGDLLSAYQRTDLLPEYTLQVRMLAVQAARQIMLRRGGLCPDGLRVILLGMDSEFPAVQQTATMALEGLRELVAGPQQHPLRELALQWLERNGSNCASSGVRHAGTYESPTSGERITLLSDGTFSWGRVQGSWSADSYEVLLHVRTEGGFDSIVMAVSGEELVWEHPPPTRFVKLPR